MSASTEAVHLVCECSQTGCAAPLEVDTVTFNQVREKPLRSFVTPGHEDLEIESVVEERPGYLVVEKHQPLAGAKGTSQSVPPD